MNDTPATPLRVDDTPAPAALEPAAPALSIQVAAVAKLNLADFQNAVPALHELAVHNGSAEAVQQLRLAIHSEPAFVRPHTWRIDRIDGGATCHIPEPDVALDGALLSRLNEAEKATLTVELLGGDDAAPTCLARTTQVVELLPRQHWGGLGQLPEMLAAFVQPNDPAVDRLLKQAAQALREQGRSGAINGYAEGPRRAWELAAALWRAVAALGLDYALPPASFEAQGQKVRSPGQVLDAGLATCLDLTLLLAAALEQASLHPLLVVSQGHAFVGLWLQEETFSTPVVDDVTALRKRLQLQELLVFETTLLTQAPVCSFSHACEQGARQLGPDAQTAFVLAVDVARARRARIKPLALAETPAAPGPASGAGEPAAPGLPAFEDAPDLPDAPAADTAALTPQDRLTRWQRKLLDLSLRNALLNFKAQRRGLLLDAPDPGALEDRLADGQLLRLLPEPGLMSGTDPRSLALHEARAHEDVRRVQALEALARHEVFVRLPAEEMDTRLVELYRSARAALQEGGANTLYLALGFLVWQREGKPGTRYKAPLLLVPVVLERKSARSGFSIRLHDDEARINPTLLEMLRQDFKLELGLQDQELPRDEAGLDVRALWNRVAHAVRDIPGWDVVHEVVLASFSFAKYLMWKDLVERTDQLRQNPVVRHLIDTPRDPYRSDIPFPDPRQLDREHPPQQTLCPLPADSSQLAAVLAAARGKDFVLIGPPGTGKSQTIANLIAQCLAEGRRVLFVAEKIAALDVVHRRLREVGLGEFCLELHSSKASKVQVMAQLGRAWSARGTLDEARWQVQAARLGTLREELSHYVERLHRRHPNGRTVFEAIGTVVRHASLPVLDLSWPLPDRQDAATLQTLRERVGQLDAQGRHPGLPLLASGPLRDVQATEWSPRWQQALVQAAQQLGRQARATAAACDALREDTGLPALRLDRPGHSALAALAKVLPAAAGQPWAFLLDDAAAPVLAQLRQGLDLLEQHRQLSSQLPPPWDDACCQQLTSALALLAERDRVERQLGPVWPTGTVQELEHGLQLLARMQTLRSQLSVQYSAQVGQLPLHRLLRDWQQADAAMWPLSAWGRRSVRKVLEAAVEDTGEPRIGADLALLVQIHALREQVEALELPAAVDGLWAGLKTRPAHVRSALHAHAALQAARQGQPWQDHEFEAAAQGHCGERWAQDVQRLRRLKALDAQIEALAPLQAASHGLWCGHATPRDVLTAAVAFERARADLARRGTLTEAHAAVADGACGPHLRHCHRLLQQRAALEQQLQPLQMLGLQSAGLWQGLDTDVARLGQALRWHEALGRVLEALAARGLDPAATRAALRPLLAERAQALHPEGPWSTRARELMAQRDALPAALDALARQAGLDEPRRNAWAAAELPELARLCDALEAAQAQLKPWCAWLRLRQAALADGLSPLVQAFEQGRLAGGTLGLAFEVNHCRWWLGAVVEQDAVIRDFIGTEHERRIHEFRELDDRHAQLTREWIRARLCAHLPAPDSVAKNSEWGVLRHELTKKKRHLPLRTLMEKIPSVVTQLTPCLLMSPLSIAQYLGTQTAPFDVVVFDEASQIPVWDAIGAMARGRQVVMVGDPRQLPPTSFFAHAGSDEDDEDVEADLESILDECLGASLPTRSLSWHYRSRHESLIAFSNHRYYGGGLVTFPSPATEDRAVSFHPVPGGLYAKGGARTNLVEARALVADLVARLRSPEFLASGQTIGVVTFNAEQQRLIEDLLDEARRQHPELERHFAEDVLEPVFVKNLESVQGDERDVMYFSITYGPDLHGTLSMNFGPLNRDGGERRLNVAITRARHALKVFASLRPEQMDLTRTQARGVRDLKHFLEFAERGPRALAEADRGSVGDFESPFEQAVAQALTRKGWQLRSQIGVSAFRIDLGVVHPDAPGRYLAGVECDGATYHRSATARDRDKLREQVLRGLGWEIVRIWSTDWWVDPEGTLDRVDAELRALLAASPGREPAPPAPAAAGPA